MTAVVSQGQYEWDSSSTGTVVYWIGAAVLAGLLHFIAIWAIIHWMKPVELPEAPSAASEPMQVPMALELVQDVPAAAAPPQPTPQEIPEEKAETPPPPASEMKAEDKPEPVAEETRPVEPQPAEPEVAEPSKVETPQEVKQPELPRSNDATQLAAPAKPQKVVTPQPPTPARVIPRRPVPPRVEPTPVVRRKPVVEPRPVRVAAPGVDRRAERAAAAAARASAAASARASAAAAARASAAAAAGARAAAAASASAASSASWRASLMAHLNRFKRFPAGASPGSVSVAFTIDRSGGVRSASLARSSGNSILDAEAVAMVRRASPVPAPPAGVGGGSMAISVPIRYSR